MKKLLLSLLLVAGVSLAAPPGEVSFALQDVTVSTLARVVLDDVAGASLIVAPEVLEDDRPVSFVLKKATVAGALKQLAYVLDLRGFGLQQVDGVYRLAKKEDEALQVFVYQPKYRGVSYLADLLGGVIPRAAIASQRLVSSGMQGQAPPVSSMPAPVETGTNAFSVIDKADKDALVIKAKAAEIALVRQVLEQVDKPVPEMIVKAVLLEVQTGETEASAVDLVASLLSKGLGSVSVNYKGGTVTDAGIKVQIGGIEAVWSALSSDKRFRVLSAPQVRVKSGGSAKFSVGAETPVLGSIQYQGNGQSQQSIEYKPSGVILDLQPQIRGEQAELKVVQQLSSFAKTETGVNGSPTLMKRELTSTVMVGPREVILLGGLDEERTTDSNYGFFFLPKWLRSTGSDKQKTEIVLMLHVERIKSPEPI